MKSYRSLKKEYEELQRKYTELFAREAESSYELSKLKAEEEQLQVQEAEIRELHQNVRKLKHDMKNHLMVIASYLNKEEYAEAKAYTSEILDKLNAVHSYIETGNSLLNHIINEKLEYARAKGISVKAEIDNLSFARMKSIDFSALLMNMLDNAIEACEKEAQPELYVSISRKRGYEVIFLKNKVEKSVLQQNPGLESTKEEKAVHGMGIQQIREIVERYEGMCDFFEEDGYFCAGAFIPE